MFKWIGAISILLLLQRSYSADLSEFENSHINQSGSKTSTERAVINRVGGSDWHVLHAFSFGFGISLTIDRRGIDGIDNTSLIFGFLSDND